MRFCLLFKEFTSSLYYCASLSECKAISRHSLWTAVSDLLIKLQWPMGFLAQCSCIFLCSVWQCLVIIFEVNSIIRCLCCNSMPFEPIWGHQFHVWINELETQLFGKSRSKLSPRTYQIYLDYQDSEGGTQINKDKSPNSLLYEESSPYVRAVEPN